MDVTLPDGVVIEGVPDGTSKVDLLGKLQQSKHPSAPALMKQMASEQALKDTSGVGKFGAGMGLAFQNIGRAAKQMVGMDTGFQEHKGMDSALTGTGAGAAGNIAGNVAAFAPTAFIPGANTVTGAGLVGAAAGALQPTDTTKERLQNMLTGGALGAGTQKLVGAAGNKAVDIWTKREAENVLKKSQNAVADETLKMGKDAGYVLPPSAVNDSWIGKRLEGVAGKAAIGQEAAVRNQTITDKLAREAASLDEAAPLSLTSLRSARKELAGPYREISALSPQAAKDLEALQMARQDSKLAWKEYNRQGVRTAYHDATAADANVARLEQALNGHADAAGNPDLVASLNTARRQIAQNRQVQDALNRGTGSVDASVIGRSLDNGAPLSGPLETIGRFQQAYKPYMREGSTIPTPGVSKSEALSSALLGTAGAATGAPGGALAGGLPFLSGPARSLLLSKPVQESAMTPNYSTGVIGKAGESLSDPARRRQLEALARALALPAVPMVNNQ